VPSREIEIGQRLRIFRESTKLSRVAFAQALGIKPETLAGYEAGRIPVRFVVVDRICKTFGLNQTWLVKAIGPMFPSHEIHPTILAKIPLKTLFSDAYEHYLWPEISERLNWILKRFPKAVQEGEIKFDWELIPPLGMPKEDQHVWTTRKAIGRMAGTVPPPLKKDFWDTMLMVATIFLNELEAGKITEKKPSELVARLFGKKLG
jgi:transcriptional regulator with XRE-family HTH domain